MLIRKATAHDMPEVLSLIHELATFEKEPDAVEIAVADLVRDGFGQSPLFNCFVAELKHQIIGIALYYFRYSTWKGKTIHLEDLIVKENHRGSGVGMALYTKIMQQAKIEKVRRVEWAVLNWNTTAIDFYKKTGAKHLSDWDVVQMDREAIDFFLNQNNIKV